MKSTGKSAGITRRDLLRKAAQTAVGAAIYSAIGPYVYAAPSNRPKPNIVYVFPDQHRQCSWAMTDPMMKTPNLTALAAQSLTFTQCTSNYPLCCPHRATLMTGKYPQGHSVMRNGIPLPANALGIGDVLKRAGYATGYVGKWHLYGAESNFVPPGPNRHGFDWWRVCTNYQHRYETKYWNDVNQVVTINGYAPTGQMDMTLDFIEQHAHEPFCIYLSWHPPHPPYAEAPPQFTKLYDAGGIKQRPNVPTGADNQRLHRCQVEYFGHVSAEDTEVGRLVAKLDQLGLSENTILCFSSDHGDMLGSFGRFGKNVPWEESINVPFIVRYPGFVPGGKTSNALFSSVDIAPTILGLAGIEVPAGDLSPMLRDERPDGPESVLLLSQGGNRAVPRWRAVRTSQFTYAKRGPSNLSPWLLYDNHADPHQLTNVVGRAPLAQTQAMLEGVLARHLKEVGEG